MVNSSTTNREHRYLFSPKIWLNKYNYWKQYNDTRHSILAYAHLNYQNPSQGFMIANDSLPLLGTE